jgi:hypothetical protein
MRRRELITGFVSLIAAPAIVRAGSLMPVRSIDWIRRVPGGFNKLEGWQPMPEIEMPQFPPSPAVLVLF